MNKPIHSNISNILLKKGDIFLSRNPMSLGKAINGVQKFWSKDNKSKYSHSGIIIDKYGTTLEALWSVKNQNLFNDYKDTEILIARCNTLKDINSGLDNVNKHKGQWYPFYRLGLMIFPPLAKYLHFGRVVCSELTCKFLNKSGLNITYYGKTPDNVHDMIKHWKDFEIIFEGKIG